MINIVETYNVLNDCRNMCMEEIIETILQQRKIINKEEFLYPSEENLLPLNSMPNIEKAMKMVEEAIKSNQKIMIQWDTDLDGVSSGAIIHRYLSHYTSNIVSNINQGKAHGLLGQDLTIYYDADLLIVVDSLDKNIDAYRELKEKGVQILVLDHHAITESVPYGEYVTLVSSQNNYENKALSGAGVVWKFCKYLDDYFLEDFADQYADLAACGLIADMSDVSQDSMENRYIVSLGLKEICNPAIKKIVGSFPFNSTSISFSIAPLVNAANRVGRNEFALHAFLADENKEVLKYVKELKRCKEDQNTEVELLLPDVIRQADDQKENKLICIHLKSVSNISGLIGNKLLEKYQKPILVLKQVESDGVKYFAGSARAVGVSDFRLMCEKTGLCEANGHELAHGVIIKEEDFAKFKDSVAEQLKNVEFKVETTIDICLDLEDVNRELIDKIKEIDRISGEGFKAVTVVLNGITEYEIGNMSKGKHLVIKPNDYLQLIKWNWTGDFTDMEDNSLLQEPLTCIGHLDSGWLGRKFCLKVICNEIKVVA